MASCRSLRIQAMIVKTPQGARIVAGYAFLVADDAYNFSISDLGGYGFQYKQFPVILDWTIGNISCDEARMDNQSFACKAINSTCFDSEHGSESGYVCKCLDGFEGNPYLSDACQGNYIICNR
ncbi:hypothetical protein PTKIN_Ptkin16aG0059900 [Pterospermum kingtungense]